MNRIFVNAQRTAGGSAFRRATLVLGAVAAGAVAAACTPQAPKGQVVAVVNGQEVTQQDLAAEARASGPQESQSPPAVLQKVIARVLLAQSAHARHLDGDPAYPSDIARLQQVFLAEKTLKATIKEPAKPSPQAVDSFISAHPNVFRDRAKLQVDEIKFRSSDDMKSLGGADTIAAVASRLQQLNVPFDRQSRAIDTAELPPALLDKISTLPADHIFFIRNQDLVLGMVVKGREAVTMTPQQQVAVATQLMVHDSTQGQIDAEVRQLVKGAKIVYQAGYAPPAKAAPSAPAAAPAPQS